MLRKRAMPLRIQREGWSWVLRSASKTRPSPAAFLLFYVT